MNWFILFKSCWVGVVVDIVCFYLGSSGMLSEIVLVCKLTAGAVLGWFV